MDLFAVIVRVTFSYLVLLALLRAAHKRAVAEATPFDFVFALVLGDMIDDVLWGDVGAAKFTIGVGTLALCQAVVGVATYRSRTLHDLLDSRPTVLLADGELVPPGLRAELVSEDDLDGLLRLQGIPRERWQEVEKVRLETGGGLSLRERPPFRPLQKEDLGES